MDSPFSLIQKAVPPERDPATGEWPEYRSLLESLTFNTPEEYAKLPKPGAAAAPATAVDTPPDATPPTDDPDAMHLDTPTTSTFPADATPMLIDADDAAIGSPLHPRPRPTPSWNLWPTPMSSPTLSLYTLILAPKYQHFFDLTSPLLPFRDRDRIAGHQVIKYYALWHRSQQQRAAMARLRERRKAEAEAREKIEGEENGAEWSTGVARRAPTKVVKRRVERVVKVGDEEWWSDSDEDAGEGGGVVADDDDDDDDDDDNDNDDNANEEGGGEEEEEVEEVVREVDVRRKKGKDRVIVEWVEEEVEVDLEERAREAVAKGEGTEAEMEGMVEMYRWLGVHEGRASV